MARDYETLYYEQQASFTESNGMLTAEAERLRKQLAEAHAALRLYANPKEWGQVADYSDASWYMNGRPWMTAYAALKAAGVDVSFTDPLPDPDDDGEPIYTKKDAEALCAMAVAAAQSVKPDEQLTGRIQHICPNCGMPTADTECPNCGAIWMPASHNQY